MSEMHSRPHRVMWFDLPVADLERASRFYAAVLGVKVSREGNFTFAVLGPAAQVEKHGGQVLIDSERNRIALHSAADN